LVAWLLAACTGGDPGSDCGPTRAVVERVIDGDTVVLDSGERIRYLLIDSPENTREVECYGPEATEFNRMLVENQEIELSYDTECLDDFGRQLAYVRVNDRDVNALMIERGFACVLFIPPNGAERRDEYEDLEFRARSGDFGLWGACETNPC
jgi:micrococcal nuclease